MNTVQASPAEIQRALDKLDAFEFEGTRLILDWCACQLVCLLTGALADTGCWRVFDRVYMTTVFDLVLNIIAENDWPLDGIPQNEIMAEAQSEFAPCAIVQTLRMHSNACSDEDKVGLRLVCCCVWSLLLIQSSYRIALNGLLTTKKFRGSGPCSCSRQNSGRSGAHFWSSTPHSW